MKQEKYLTVTPYIISSIFILVRFHFNAFQAKTPIIIPAIIFVLGCTIAYILKLATKIWFLTWLVFASIYSLWSFDCLLFSDKIYRYLFYNNQHHVTAFVFPGQISVLGLIALSIFFIANYIFDHTKRYGDEAKYLSILSFSFCYLMLALPMYYGNPGVRDIFNMFQQRRHSSFTELNAICLSLVLILMVFIIILFFVFDNIGKDKKLMIPMLLNILILFVAMHLISMIKAVKEFGLSSLINSNDLVFLLGIYIKYIWIYPGTAYMLCYMWYKSFRKKQG